MKMHIMLRKTFKKHVLKTSQFQPHRVVKPEIRKTFCTISLKYRGFRDKSIHNCLCVFGLDR